MNSAATAQTSEASAHLGSIGLCLSGGGFRAALFHLGALRRLNELGILSQISTISSVSGGSITAAHLAAQLNPWPEPGQPFATWEDKVASPFRRFASKDLRTGPVLKRLLPWNWFKSTTQVEALAAKYQQHLIGLTLPQLPIHPRFIFCATDLVFGVNWVFERERVGDYRAGYITPSPDWPVACAVASSSCFPPIFGPWNPRLPNEKLIHGQYSEPDRNNLVRAVRLSDGGVYDNLGTEPIWKNHNTVIVSDGGAPFRFDVSAMPWRLGRYLAIVGNQSGALRKRWLIANFKTKSLVGTYWGISSDLESYPKFISGGYSKALITDFISRIRTDLDRFSEGEIAILENHGYLLAEAAAQSHLGALIKSSQPLKLPHEDWMDEQKVKQALAESHKRKLFRLRERDNLRTECPCKN